MNRGPYNKKSFETFRKTVAAAGTAEQLHADLPIPDGFGLIMKALDGNTGDIEFANSKAKAEGSDVFILDAGQSIALSVTNANAVWLDVTVSGEGVVFYVERN